MTTHEVQDRLELDLAEVGEVRIRIVAGDVSVTATDDQPRLEVRRLAGRPVHVELRDGELLVTHEQPRQSLLGQVFGFLSDGRQEASVTVTVPRGTAADVGTVSAPVVLSGLGGRVAVKTVSGDLTLDEISGDALDVKSVSGEVEARRIAADLKAKAVSGSVTVVDGSSRWVQAKTVSGDVTLDLELDPAGHYELTTVSGNVSLRTGGEPSLVVEAASVSGSVSSDFDLRWEDDRPGRRRLRASLGEAGARLAVKTVSGDFRLLRKTQAA